MVAKLQKGAGAPQREPVVSADEQKAMIAFYHKKQQEAEALALEDEDAYYELELGEPEGASSRRSPASSDVKWRGA